MTLTGALSHTVRLSTGTGHNISRIDNELERFADYLKECKSKLADVQTQLETARGEVDRPFPQEQEYEKSERLKNLNILLNMDEKDAAIFDGEPDVGDNEPPTRDTGRER